MNNLLGEVVKVSPDLLLPYPNNPRRGDIEAIKQSLLANGQFTPLIVQLSTNYILSGNHTYQAAVSLGWTEIDVAFVDVEDNHARRILLAANRISDLGGYDEIILANLLAEAQNEGDELLLGTGYTPDEVDKLLESVIALTLPEEDAGESMASTAALFDRIMPPSPRESLLEDMENVDDELSSSTSSSPISNTVAEQATEFVIFRLGELQAKIPRSSYEIFVRKALRDNGGSLSLAGVAMAVKVGLPQEVVEPAVPHGAERWL